MCMDAVGVPVQTRGEHWSGPFPPGRVQVGEPLDSGLPSMERGLRPPMRDRTSGGEAA